MKKTRVGLGQDSHRFLPPDTSKPCIIGGVIFSDCPGFNANSDGDVVYHSICNAITSLTGTLILGGIADDLCLKDGITDSGVYLEKGAEILREHRQEIVHIALSLEAKKPKFKDAIAQIRQNIAKILGIDPSQIGITATSGEGLTDFGCGEGVQCLCILTSADAE